MAKRAKVETTIAICVCDSCERRRQCLEPLHADKLAFLTAETARYVARYDCLNVDPDVNPVDLLRDVAAAFIAYDDEISDLKVTIEQLEAGQSEKLVALEVQLEDNKRDLEGLLDLNAKIDKLPWLRQMLERVP